MPNYFDNIVTGNFYTIDLPRPNPKLLGFDGCIVIACESSYHIQFSPLSYNYNWVYERCFRFYLESDIVHPHFL